LRSAPFASSIAFQKEVEQLPARSEIGLPQGLNRAGQIEQQIMLSGEIENAESPLDRNASPPCFRPSCFIIRQQNVRAQLNGQSNRFTFVVAQRDWEHRQ
jgi:hypothetical protein